MLDRTLSPDADAVRLPRGDKAPAGWAVSRDLVPYPQALEAMEARAQAIAEGRAGELVWLLEHPALYTAGVSARDGDLIDPERFPVFRTGRGGQFTYHGPGQRVAYAMLDLNARGRDVRAFVGALEAWIIGALARLGVEGAVRPGRVGVWVETPRGEEKIAAVGVKVRRWVSFHGIALNVAPDLDHFTGIVPCGLPDFGVTSLKALGAPATLPEGDAALKTSFEAVFGPLEIAEPPA